MAARIYRPAKTAMQSGKAQAEAWTLEFEPESPRKVEPLMGYTSSRDMKSQIHLSFETKEEAIAYAQKNGIAYSVQEPKEIRRRVVSYSENFRFDRKQPWTH
ncbi:ETC complex I subunit [Phyllobacterium sp. 628]|uniref:ETC complex I subunit n=1 Tax=Phyllobacterium sp. 628 TaxID=2718938 RepID=UPI0016628781|nr:ETC complex I subunit [Phyllobacterium sp. 628]QND52561.1 ETC complex I subunit [Phyllobacterium sp. 628]